MKTLNVQKEPMYREVIQQLPSQTIEEIKTPKEKKEFIREPIETPEEPLKKLSTYQIPDDPHNPPHRGKLISRKTLWFLVISIIVLSLLLILNLFWFNFSVAEGLLKENSTINNNINVEPAQVDVPINFQNNNTNINQPIINVNVTISNIIPNNITITTTNAA